MESDSRMPLHSGMKKTKGGSVTGDSPEWSSSCALAAESEDYFREFRSSPVFAHNVEGTPRLGGQLLIRKLAKNPVFLASILLIAKSDLYGSPLKLLKFKSTSGELLFSPTTLRYVNNCLNSIGLFGDDIFNQPIIEIGGGYGGECKIFNDIAQVVTRSTTSLNWTIYDLSTSTGLIKKWIKLFGYTAKFAEIGALVSKPHDNYLVISNGALSEMRGAVLENYFEKIVIPAKRGYFITNFETHSTPHGGWTTETFLNKLILAGKSDAKVLPAHEFLSWSDSGNSTLIVFGMGSNRPMMNSRSDPFKYQLITKLNEYNMRVVNIILKSSILNLLSKIAYPLYFKFLFKDRYRCLYK